MTEEWLGSNDLGMVRQVPTGERVAEVVMSIERQGISPMLTRVLAMERQDGSVEEVTVAIAQPELRQDRMWQCRYLIAKIDSEVRTIVGSDEVDAVVKVLQIIGAHLDGYALRNGCTFSRVSGGDDDGHGFPSTYEARL